MAHELIGDITHTLAEIRLAASLALSTALSEQQELSSEIVDSLLEIYEEKMKVNNVKKFKN